MFYRREQAAAIRAVTLVIAILMTASVAIPAFASPAQQQADQMMAGSGPETALTPTGERETLTPNEKRWYTFRYVEGADGDDDGDEPSDALAELTMAYPDSIDFEVWTEYDVRMWANGEDFYPTGAGTPAFDDEDGDSDNRDRRLLRWVGSGEATTTWYIVVENETEAPAPYRLTVSGKAQQPPRKTWPWHSMWECAQSSEIVRC